MKMTKPRLQAHSNYPYNGELVIAFLNFRNSKAVFKVLFINDASEKRKS